MRDYITEKGPAAATMLLATWLVAGVAASASAQPSAGTGEGAGASGSSSESGAEGACAAILGASRAAGGQASYEITGSSGAKGGSMRWLPADPAYPDTYTLEMRADLRYEWLHVVSPLTCEGGSAMQAEVRYPNHGTTTNIMPPRELLRFPLEPGQSWLYTGAERDGDGTDPWSARSLVAGTHVLEGGTVETPAGSFETTVVQMDESRDGYTQHISLWVAQEPCLLVVRRLVTSYGGIDSPDEDWVLESYSCGGETE